MGRHGAGEVERRGNGYAGEDAPVYGLRGDDAVPGGVQV
nr:MAG TPA: hypothetical protein [Caudoviricetes sp.]